MWLRRQASICWLYLIYLPLIFPRKSLIKVPWLRHYINRILLIKYWKRLLNKINPASSLQVLNEHISHSLAINFLKTESILNLQALQQFVFFNFMVYLRPGKAERCVKLDWLEPYGDRYCVLPECEICSRTYSLAGLDPAAARGLSPRISFNISLL